MRYEVDRWNKEQDCHFQSFGENGGLVVSETERTDKEKRRLWNFACVDSSLYETRSDLIPLPDKLKFFDSDCDRRFAAFLFVNEDNKKAADTLDFLVVSFNREEHTYKTFWDKWPEKSVPLSIDVVDGTMMLALNNKNGNGSLSFYDLTSNACVKVHTPCMITCIKELNKPRYMNIGGIFECYEKQVVTMTYDTLKDHPLIDKSTIGLLGSPTNILTSFTPPQKGAGMMLPGDGKETTDKLAGILAAKHII